MGELLKDESAQDADNEKAVDRRDFCAGAFASTTALAFALGSKKAYAKQNDQSRLRLAHVSELQIGSPIDFHYPTENDPGFLVKLGTAAAYGLGPESDLVAFLRSCMHKGCLLPNELIDIEKLVLGPCLCHRSTFDLRNNGTLLFGRASQNLVQVELEFSGDEIYAVGLMGIPYGRSLEARIENP